MLLLYQYEISPFCDKVRRVLDYKRVPYETRDVRMYRSLVDVRRVNPVGKPPALVSDSVSSRSSRARFLN